MERKATETIGAFPYTLGAHTWKCAAVSLKRKLKSRKLIALIVREFTGLVVSIAD